MVRSARRDQQAGVTGLYKSKTDAEVNNLILRIGDLPIANGGDDPVGGYKMVLKFKDFLAVSTIDTSNGANKVYTQRAYANWTFDGSGTFDVFGKYNFVAGRGVRTDSGNPNLTEVTNGTIVPTIYVGPNVPLMNPNLP